MVHFIKRADNVLCTHAKFVLILLTSVQMVLLLLLLWQKGPMIAPDTEGYVAPAKSFLETGKMLNGDGTYTLFRTPGYSLFLAVIYFVFHNSNLAVALIQIALTTSITIMIYKTVEALSTKKSFGILASLLFICDEAYYAAACSILSDTLSAFLVMLSIFLLVQWRTKEKTRMFVGGALSLNLSVLVRPAGIYLTLIIAVFLAVQLLRRKVQWKLGMVYIAIFLVVWQGWSARNYVRNGVWTYCNIRELSYLAWYAPETYALKEKTDDETAYSYFENLLYEQYPEYESMSVTEKMAVSKEIGGTYLKNNLGWYLLLNIRGLVIEMIEPGSPYLTTFGLPGICLIAVELFCSGMLLVCYLLYAYSFLRNIRRLSGADWALLFTAMYYMASTAVLGYSRFRVAFYMICVTGAFSCLRHVKLPVNGK